ncbi:hypothetical protein B0H14DRAFT_2861973, partial [Mycena olivaceomarginata]
DFISLVIPPLAPVIRAGLSLTSTVSEIYAKIGQLLGFWSTSGVAHETSQHAQRGLYDSDHDKRD